MKKRLRVYWLMVLTVPLVTFTNHSIVLGGVVTVVYDPITGKIALDAQGNELSAIQMVSASEVFAGPGPSLNLDGDFDVDPLDESNPLTFKTKLAKALFPFGDPPHSFGSISFGPVAMTDITVDFLKSDLSVDGVLFGGTEFGPEDVGFSVIPEPATVVLVAFGILLLGIHDR